MIFVLTANQSYLMATLLSPLASSRSNRLTLDVLIAVLDQHRRVHGLQGLQVADASIMPDYRRQHKYNDDKEERTAELISQSG